MLRASGLVLGTNVVQLPAWDMTSTGQQQQEHMPPVDSLSHKTDQSSIADGAEAAPDQPFIEFNLLCHHRVSAPATTHGRLIPRDACTPRPQRVQVSMLPQAQPPSTTASTTNSSSACSRTASLDGGCAPPGGGVPIVDVMVGPGGEGGVGVSPACSGSSRWMWGSKALVTGLVLVGWGGARVSVKRLYGAHREGVNG